MEFITDKWYTIIARASVIAPPSGLEPYEAGDVLVTLDSSLGEPSWLTPGMTYSTATYPDAATVFGDDGGTFTVDTYTVPSGYYAYVYSGV